jgi:hypothetical protein
VNSSLFLRKITSCWLPVTGNRQLVPGNIFGRIFVIQFAENHLSTQFWGRPVLTGCVKLQASMQAHEGRALITALNNLRGENTYAMAA